MKTRKTTTTTSRLSSLRPPRILSLIIVVVVVVFTIISSKLVAPSPSSSIVSPSNRHGGIRFSPETSAYSGLTFTFDPRLDKRVDLLHFEHWLSIMQQSSELLHEALNGRAHLGEVRVLIPYKWRHLQWPVLNKPGAPIPLNRRLRYIDSDVIVGFDDPIYKETPFAVQHDECARQGLHISMPISFLEQEDQPLAGMSNEARLKARMFVREFASHRYGLFKESGFRNDFMYPPFASLAGLTLNSARQQHQQQSSPRSSWFNNKTTMLNGESSSGGGSSLDSSLAGGEFEYSLRGFDEHWNECSFDTQPASGLPTAQSANCVPYLSKPANANINGNAANSNGGDKFSGGGGRQQSFNLMSADPFSHGADLSARPGAAAAANQPPLRHSSHIPVEWRDLADSVKWHFCGDNFAAPTGQAANQMQSSPSSSDLDSNSAGNANGRQPSNDIRGNLLSSSNSNNNNIKFQASFAHNQLANNKQNVLCNERSAMDVIKASDDFKGTAFSPSTFNRLPEPQFSFLQEMPPRVILCVEYSAHLFQSRRLDHAILEAAIGKFFAYDLMADSELALVLFGQRNSSRNNFEKLDSSIKSRLTLYNPAIDPFDEPVKYYTEQELAQLWQNNNNQQPSSSSSSSSSSQQQPDEQQQQQSAGHHQLAAKIVKGTCSFAKLMHEVGALQAQRTPQYDDIGVDIVIISSGLFVEDEPRLEEIIRAQFKPDNHQINLIIYPSTMLFDTKSHEGFVVLDALESEAIVRQRLQKLLLIQRLTNANIHLVKEHLDANGDVKMSTLIQFYQIFDHISKGHSWDQLQSMMLLAHEPAVELTRHLAAPGGSANGGRLSFKFKVDASIQNELIVAFIDPKQHHNQAKPGKRFSIRNLQLWSPSGQLVLTDSHPWPLPIQHQQHQYQSLADPDQALLAAGGGGSTSLESRGPLDFQDGAHESDASAQAAAAAAASTSIESAMFPFRTQLGLAGFHLKASHLALMSNNNNNNNGTGGNWGVAGQWTLSATSDEPIQASAIAMARVNPSGDTLTSNCWIQTYHQQQQPALVAEQLPSSDNQAAIPMATTTTQPPLKMVKVFVQTRGPAGVGPPQELQARLEVQDELGNIVQNVNMLDDGLGAPDITRGDGIHSQFVQRAHRPGFYKVTVEVTGQQQHLRRATQAHTNQQQQQQRRLGAGQDNTCCGSFVPQSGDASPHSSASTSFLTRQLYCGTFYVDRNNRLGQQRPPRVNNLTVVQVDQENRRVTVRWFEPLGEQLAGRQPPSSKSSSAFELLSTGGAEPRFGRSADAAGRAARGARSSGAGGGSRLVDEDAHEDTSEIIDFSAEVAAQNQRANLARLARPSASVAANQLQQQETISNRYEFKLFSDRDILKRSFDAKQHEVGYKFNDLNVIDSSSSSGGGYNATTYGGMKEVTLRIPSGREGIYFIAMKVYNNLGIPSQLSNIVQFWMRNNLTNEEAELIYGQSVTIDADGNVYDKNGELIGQRGGPAATSSGGASHLNGGAGGGLDGISVIVVISVCAFLFSIVCVSLLACLIGSARKSLAAKEADLNGTNNGGGGGDQLSTSKKNKKNKNKFNRKASKSHGSGTAILAAGNGGGGGGGGGSGSSMVSSTSQCEGSSGSQRSGAGSLGSADSEAGNCQDGALGDLASKLTGDELTYSQLRHQHQLQQQQADQIKSAYLLAAAAAAANHHQHQSYQSNDKVNQQQPWLQHTIVNGYAYATVANQQQQQQQFADDGDLNQNGLGLDSQQQQPQSWPADVLLGHYDKVKQQHDRSSSPAMHLEHGQFGSPANGLPRVADDTANQQQQQQLYEQSYLIRRQQQQMPSYFNQQLQQQLSTVLRSKQRMKTPSANVGPAAAAAAADDERLDSSPALEGVAHEGHDSFTDGYHHHQQAAVAPPPPAQYIYQCSEANIGAASGGGGGGGLLLGQVTGADPSIYSQATGLHQVVTSPTGDTSYYANSQHLWPAAASSVANIYGTTTGQLDPYNQQHQTVHSSSDGSHCLEDSYDKPNSAISEV